MTTHEDLIAWIHRVEYDPNLNSPTKRRAALVSELYFERTLSRQANLNFPTNITTGWMSGFNAGQRSRRWLKFHHNDNTGQRETSRIFIRDIAQHWPQDDFYQVSASVTPRGDGLPPRVTFSFTQRIQHEQRMVFRPTAACGALSLRVNRLCEQALGDLHGTDPDNDIAPWLRPLSEEALKKLLAWRCLMNFGGLYLTDIDGLGIDPQGQLTLIEFKRKDPAQGIRYQRTRPTSLHEYLEIARTLNRGNRAAAHGHDQLPDLHNTRDWSPVRTPCFGLDTSHIRNLELCLQTGWNYRYLIWNHAKATPAELFNDDLTPRQPPALHMLDVGAGHIDGIAKAPESGSYTRGRPRYQLMIPVCHFQPYPAGDI